MSTRPGWYPDPSGRFPKRWHDGEDWTASVLDPDGQQGYDQLPPAGAPAVASLPAPARPAPPPPPSPAGPPPPPGASSAQAPSSRAPEVTWQAPPSAPPAPSSPSSGGSSWQPGQPWQSAQSASARPYTPTSSGSVWSQQQPVTTASLGLTPPPAVTASSTWTNLVVYGLVGIAAAAVVLSLFALDWYSGAGQSAGFRDLVDGSVPNSAPFLDKVTVWYYEWLGFVVAGLALLSAVLFVIARLGSHRVGHLIAATDAAVGALLSTFAIVRLFRTGGFDPEPGAWLLPAGYLVLLVAVVISARNEST